MFNWITPAGVNLVLYKDGDAVKCFNQSTSAITTLLSGLNGAVQIAFADLDVWVYFCGYDATGTGTFQARIYDGVNVDKAFRGPITLTTATAVDGGAGFCTAGTHYLGFVYQNRTGYSGVPTTATNYPITATLSVSFAVTATTNASPDVLSVPGHTFVNGETVTGTGATGDTAINGVFLVASVIAGTSLELTDLQGNPIAGNGVYTGGGRLTAPDLITAAGNTLVTGNTMSITGATGDTAINGAATAVVVTPNSTFTLLNSDGNPVNSNGAYTGGGVLTVPLQVTLTQDNRRITVSVTIPAQPDGGTDANGGVQATLFLIATPANNASNWSFIPNYAPTGQVGEQPVPFNTPVTLTFVMNIPDFTILADYVGADGLGDANPNFLFLSQDSSGNGPFSPNFVSVYGLRMVYGVGTIAYASEQDNPQQLAADLNQIILPSQRQIGMAFQLPNSSSLYLTGDRWTAYVTDNNDEPSTWAPPINVSNALGAPFPHCVCYATGSNNAWIATQPGVYSFDGTYADLPLTYLISDLWKGVNWTAADLFEMADDVANLKLYVTVAFNPTFPTLPSQILVFDYQNGKKFDGCDISYDIFTAAPTLGSIAVVRELNGTSNAWIGPSSAGQVVRYNTSYNVGVYTDQGVAISSFWISGLFLGTNEMTSQMIRVGSADIWIRGAGECGIAWRGPDNQVTVTSALLSLQGVAVDLSATPGIMYQTKLDFTHIENFTFSVGTGGGPDSNPGDYFSLSGFRPYYKPDLYNR